MLTHQPLLDFMFIHREQESHVICKVYVEVMKVFRYLNPLSTHTIILSETTTNPHLVITLKHISSTWLQYRIQEGYSFEPCRKNGRRWDFFGTVHIYATINLMSFKLSNLE